VSRLARSSEGAGAATDAGENPLALGLTMRRVPEPCAVTIFGASGDLTQRKLMPALYCLAFNRFLPDQIGIVGVARTPMSDEEFRARMREAVEEHGRCEFRTVCRVAQARSLGKTPPPRDSPEADAG